MVCGEGNYIKGLVTISKLGYQFLCPADYELVRVDMVQKGLLGLNHNLAKKGFLRKVEARNMVAIYNNITSEEDVKTLYAIGAHVIGTPNPEAVENVIKKLDKEADK